MMRNSSTASLMRASVSSCAGAPNLPPTHIQAATPSLLQPLAPPPILSALEAPLPPPPLDASLLPSDGGAAGLVSARALGLAAALGVGLFGGSILVPLGFLDTAYKGTAALAFLPSFGAGCLGGAPSPPHHPVVPATWCPPLLTTS
jgi:hypothetical protein